MIFLHHIHYSLPAGTAKPPHWPKPVYELDEEDSGNSGFVNEDFIVWMRTAAFPTFKKLHRRLNRIQYFTEGLPAGNYSFNITYSILSHYFFLQWRKVSVHLGTSYWFIPSCAFPFFNQIYLCKGIHRRHYRSFSIEPFVSALYNQMCTFLMANN